VDFKILKVSSDCHGQIENIQKVPVGLRVLRLWRDRLTDPDQHPGEPSAMVAIQTRNRVTVEARVAFGSRDLRKSFLAIGSE
jgi:hypothetical protein